MPIVVLPFTAGHREWGSALLRALPRERHGDLTVIASTAGDLTAHGLRFSPDVDAALRLGAPATPGPGAVVDELRAYGIEDDWFDFDAGMLAAALVRTRLLGLGYSQSQIALAMRSRYAAEHHVLPLSDQSLESHVVADSDDGPRAQHVRLAGPRAPGARALVSGLEGAKAAPGVLGAIRKATHVVLLPAPEPWSENVALEASLALPGVRDALSGTRADLVSPESSAFQGLGPTVSPLTSLEALLADEERAAAARSAATQAWGTP